MKQKVKIITLNILIAFLSFTLIFQVVFSIIKTKFSTANESKMVIEAKSQIEVIEKKGLLDLVGQGVDVNLDNQILITNKNDFVLVFNGYFEKLMKNGGYSLKRSGMVLGTASLVVGSVTAYQATQGVYQVDENGSIFIETITAEVPSPSGSTTGHGEFLGKKIWLEGGTQKSQETHNVGYLKENNSYLLTANYENVSIKDENVDREFSYLPFKVEGETIDEFNIAENSMSYDISISLNFDGYKQIAIDSMNQAKAVRMPSFAQFKVDITMDRWGNVVSMSVYQVYDLTVTRPVIGEVTSNTVSNENFVIKRKDD